MFVLNGNGRKRKTVTGEIVMKYTLEVGGGNDKDRIASVMEMFKDRRDDVLGDFLPMILYSVEFGDPRVLQPFRKSIRVKRRRNEGHKNKD